MNRILEKVYTQFKVLALFGLSPAVSTSFSCGVVANVFGNLRKRLFGRPHALEGGSKGAVAVDAGSGSISEVWLYPDSEELHKQTLLQARRIDQRVFQIGRRVSDAVHYPHDDPPDLLIVENPPYTLSRLQCEIEIDTDRVILRDLGSCAGTVLDNKRLWKSSRKPSSVVVPKGSHALILGLSDGPFRFRLEVR